MKANQREPRKLPGRLKVITICCSLMMVSVLFFPIWKIELVAPQYPEGLVLKIHTNKLAGNVDVINGLNHYIGMRTLHTEDFYEFKVLPYMLGGFAALGIFVLLFNRRKYYNAWLVIFLLMSFTSMADFYRWEYDYGHELNPDAPIKVPGMAYQPPLIGYKQLLNFGAFSIPDTGGWIFIGAGVLLVAGWVTEFTKDRKLKKAAVPGLAAMAFPLLFLSSCSTGPQPIDYGKEACNFCKMNIVDEKFATQGLSVKGKSFHFDDVHCLAAFLKNGGIWRNEVAAIYFSDFNTRGNWINADLAFLLQSDSLHSPMGGNTIAFSSEAERDQAFGQFNGKKLLWKDINPFEKN